MKILGVLLSLLGVSVAHEKSWETLLQNEPPQSLIVYDLRYAYEMSAADGYEETQLVSALAGLVNRNEPNLYLILEDIDSTWLAEFTAPGKWLFSTELTNITSGNVEDLLSTFDVSSGSFDGAVVYDPSVWCSSSVALTSAGADNLIPMAYRPDEANSLYFKLIQNGPQYEVIVNLVGLFTGDISGSVKEDCYVWATNNYIKTNKSDATHLNYYIDYYWASNEANAGNDGWEKAEIPNLDYSVSKRGFFFDLSVWADEAPIDEPSQPLGSDLYAFKYILSAAYNTTLYHTISQDEQSSMIVIHGFTPWAYKYVTPNGNHEGVETEWATVLITSAYNAIVDADACCIGNMANAALWQHYPLADRYVQPTIPPSQQQLIDRGLLTTDGIEVVGGKLYYMFYAGDYDSAAWLYSQLLSRWEDPIRGQVPIGWGIDPMLSLRFPPIFPLILNSMSSNDSLISGDSGAGYLNPTMLYGDQRVQQSGIEDSGVASWTTLNKALNNQFDISFTGFSISGDAPQPTSFDEAIYFNFSSNGVVDQGFSGMEAHLTPPKLPVITQYDISSEVEEATSTILSYLDVFNQDQASWMMFRSVLTSPSYLNSVAQSVQIESSGNAIALTPLELSYLFRVAYGSDNNDRVTYVNDTLPATMEASDPSLSFEVMVRNDGWNTLVGGSVGLMVSSNSLQPVMRISAQDQKRRDVWVNQGLVPLSHGHETSNLRRILTREGYVGYPVHTLKTIEDSNSSQIFLLSEDLGFSETTSVSANLSLDAVRAQVHNEFRLSESADYILSLEYQLVYVDSDSNAMIKSFAELGTIPWQAEVLIQAS